MKPTEQELQSMAENAGAVFGIEQVWFVKGFENAISQMQPEWVSVKDRLPQGPDIVYLVSVKNKNKENGIPLIDIAVFDSDGIWQKSTVWEDVTHWMPLPNPPTK